jgi:hypothetical protein
MYAITSGLPTIHPKPGCDTYGRGTSETDGAVEFASLVAMRGGLK